MKRTRTALIAWVIGAVAAPLLAAPVVHAEEGRAGGIFYERALRYVRARKPDKALEYFQKALPHYNHSSDIFYNLVNVAEALKDWQRVHLYASGFLYLEPEGDDAKDITRKQKAAAKWLGKQKAGVVAVSFQVDPPGVEIVVDHVPLGRARRAAVELPPGAYTARAQKVDFVDWEQSFEVVAGAPTVVKGKLAKMIFHGYLKIETTPPDGVQVFVDDEAVGTTPLEAPLKLETRRYLVRFEKEGWDRWIRYVEIQKNDTYELSPSLEKTGTTASR